MTMTQIRIAIRTYARAYVGYLKGIGLISLLMFLGACATKQPILYPNAHYKAVGKQASEHDIKECMRLAEGSGVSEGKGKSVAKQTAGGAAIGAATAGAWGLVRGDAGSRAAAGAAAGGAGGLTRGALNSNNPDPVFKNFVQRCLRERGYDVIGWQ